MKRIVVWRDSARRSRRGSRRASASDSGNQRCDVAEATARTTRLRLAIFSCIGRNRSPGKVPRCARDDRRRRSLATIVSMRNRVLTIFSAVLGIAAAGLAFAAFLSFRAALSARLDHAAALEAAAVRPAAAARLAEELLAHRLALVSESESRAVSGAFRRDAGAEALDAYRKADGNAALAEEARKALAAERSPEPVGDVAFLRAIRGLRAEAAQTPSSSRPQPPASATRAGWLLLSAMVAAAIAAFLAFAAGRSRPATT